MNRLFNTWLNALSEKTTGFRLYLLLVDLVAFGLSAVVVNSFQPGEAVKWILTFFAYILAALFFGLVIGSFFKSRKAARIFVYSLVGILAAAILATLL